jgi:flagellin
MVINTNMGAINAQRILDSTAKDQSVSMERLTSGLRINRSADDAAGLAVATGMTTQIRGTDQAIRNANDGIGLLQTVDGASEEVTNMLQRMRELGLQSMNGTYNSSNRVEMQAEFKQLQSEVQRIADTTKFNGMNVMNASSFSAFGQQSVSAAASVGFSTAASGLKLQVGWEVSASANQMKIALMNFSSLSAIQAGVRLMSGNSMAFSVALSVAKDAISKIDRGLSAIKTMRSAWGALQNRLDYTVSNLSNVNENISASRSRIQDADFAKESANLARTQVLQQAGMSMLSQSNSNSQNVLSLLR